MDRTVQGPVTALDSDAVSSTVQTKITNELDAKTRPLSAHGKRGVLTVRSR
jgi:hypothetical protein